MCRCNQKCSFHNYSAALRSAHHHGDSFTVAHKVHVGLPAVPLDDLSGGAGVVHGVSRHQILTVWRPGQTQDVGRPSTLKVTEREMVLNRSTLP